MYHLHSQFIVKNQFLANFKRTRMQRSTIVAFSKKKKIIHLKQRVTGYLWTQLVMTTALKNHNLTLRKAEPRVFALMRYWKDNDNKWGPYGAGPEGWEMIKYKLWGHRAWREDIRQGGFPVSLLPVPVSQGRLIQHLEIDYCHPRTHCMFSIWLASHIIYSYHWLIGPLIHSCLHVAYKRSNALRSAECLLNHPHEDAHCL